MPDEDDLQQRARLAAEALARAKADARARGQRAPTGYRGLGGGGQGAEGQPGPGRSGTGQPGTGQPGTGRSGTGLPGAGQPRRRRPSRLGRGRREDPQPLAAAIDGLLADQGWRTAAAVGSVFGRWDQIVGPALAAHTRPVRYGDGELVVTADSTAWATQVRLLAATLVRRLNEELGDGTVRRVIVRGPAPPRQPGAWRVRGPRRSNGDYG